MKDGNLRGPYQKVASLFLVGWLFDKIRLHQAGNLPQDYLRNFGFCAGSQIDDRGGISDGPGSGGIANARRGRGRCASKGSFQLSPELRSNNDEWTAERIIAAYKCLTISKLLLPSSARCLGLDRLSMGTLASVREAPAIWQSM